MRFLLLSTLAWAQENGAEHAGTLVIPWQNIMVQALNFFLLLAFIIYLLRHTVREHFSQRAAEYRELVDRAEAARNEAERNYDQAKDRLLKLEAGAEQSANNARTESERLRQRLVQEAQALSARLQAEAHKTAILEVEKAKVELRRELLDKALRTSSENLRKGLGSVEQKKLQNEFVDKIEVVGG